MATAIASLPNEVSENKVALKISEKEINKTLEQNNLSQDSIQQVVRGLQSAGEGTHLQNREIPITNDHIVQDEEVKPNFVPEAEHDNYIENEQSSIENMIKKSKEKKTQQDRLDIIYAELQTPILVMILFFFFQLPYFQKLLSRYLPALFSRDGNPLFSGYLFKTVIFGGAFYGLTKLSKEVSEFSN